MKLKCFLRISAALIALCVYGTMASAHAETIVFTNTGNWQTFLVPSHVTRVFVELWGAGGGASTYDFGGGGAFVAGYLYVTPGTTLSLHVGGAGFRRPAKDGGTGGTRTAILLSGTELVDAGSGGGAGFHATFGGLAGGAGGVERGRDGSPWVVGGAGGTQTGGGAGGGLDSSNGVQFQGGYGAGGSGGGGWYGGGGGGWDSFLHYYRGGGGGGSSYITDPSFDFYRGAHGDGVTPGGTDEPHYLPGIGRGGVPYEAAGNGEIVISY